MTKYMFYREVDSTNLEAKRISKQFGNTQKELVISTQFQSRGRGQKGTHWESTKGENALFSYLIYPNMILSHQFYISKITALSIVDVLHNYGLNALIKWPNDIYIERKKIAGILIENTIKSNKIDTSIIGIGINVNQTHFSKTIAQKTTSLYIETRAKTEIKSIIKEVINRLQYYFYTLSNGSYKTIDNMFENYLFGKNEQHYFCIQSHRVRATILGVNIDGRLKLLIDGKTKWFNAKSLTLIL